MWSNTVLKNNLKIIFRNISKQKTYSLINILGFAIGIAWPVAYFAANKWLENFAYRINTGFWLFILSGIIALSVALFTISYQTLKVSTANPAEALRFE